MQRQTGGFFLLLFYSGRALTLALILSSLLFSTCSFLFFIFVSIFYRCNYFISDIHTRRRVEIHARLGNEIKSNFLAAYFADEFNSISLVIHSFLIMINCLL
jgi:hypothetical protein